jgi:hypothetical protein
VLLAIGQTAIRVTTRTGWAMLSGVLAISGLITLYVVAGSRSSAWRTSGVVVGLGRQPGEAPVRCPSFRRSRVCHRLCPEP